MAVQSSNDRSNRVAIHIPTFGDPVPVTKMWFIVKPSNFEEESTKAFGSAEPDGSYTFANYIRKQLFGYTFGGGADIHDDYLIWFQVLETETGVIVMSAGATYHNFPFWNDQAADEFRVSDEEPESDEEPDFLNSDDELDPEVIALTPISDEEIDPVCFAPIEESDNGDGVNFVLYFGRHPGNRHARNVNENDPNRKDWTKDPAHYTMTSGTLVPVDNSDHWLSTLEIGMEDHDMKLESCEHLTTTTENKPVEKYILSKMLMKNRVDSEELVLDLVGPIMEWVGMDGHYISLIRKSFLSDFSSMLIGYDLSHHDERTYSLCYYVLHLALFYLCTNISFRWLTTLPSGL